MNVMNMAFPPNGYHHWREADTAAIILNYHQENFTFLEPRINQRGTSSGITGSELPIYQYSAALLYNTFGPQHFLARALTLLAGCLALWFLFLIVRQATTNSALASLAAWCAACSPLFAFYSHKIMPDIWMIALSLAAAYFLISGKSKGIDLRTILGVLLLASAAAIKPTALAISFPIVAYAFVHRNEGEKSNRVVVSVLASSAALVLAVLWYWHANAVNDKHHAVGIYVGGDTLLRFAEVVFHPDFPKMLMLRWPTELWIGLLFVPFWVLGVVVSFKQEYRLIIWSWVIGCYLAFMPTAHHTTTHDYYSLPAVAPFAIFTAMGAIWLLQYRSWTRWIAIVILLAGPIATYSRISHRVEKQVHFETMRTDAARIIGERDLVIVHESTTAIRLYELNRRGWVFRTGIDSVIVNACIDSGAAYLVLDSSLSTYPVEMQKLIDSIEMRIGPCFAYRTR